MPIKQGTLLGDTLDKMPASVVKHLAYLQCAKLALFRGVFKNSGDDSCYGAQQVADDILSQLVSDPVELKRRGRMDGVFLKKALFKPEKAILSPWESLVYQAALHTAEIQMRGLHDTK